VTGELLAVQAVSRSFGGLRALQDVSFSVTPGQVAAIIGPNGAGKSTLFNIIAGSLRPDRGRVELRGRLITGASPHEIAGLGVARTFQTTRLFTRMTVVENVMVGAHVRMRAGFLSALLGLPWTRREEAVALGKARGILSELGLAAHQDRTASTLSFGQRRVLELARALAAEPEVLLLDEPAAGLTIAETERLGELIGGFKQRGITVLLVEHDMSLVMGICDEVLVLSSGRRIAEGTPREIQSNPEVISVYLGADDA